MPINWTPNGTLDIATDPSDLPEQTDGKSVVSGALTRCTNLQLDRGGIAQTRPGSTNLNATAMGLITSKLVEFAGTRVELADTGIYQDEASIGTGYTSAKWGAAVYAPYNVSDNIVYATNGTDRVKVEGGAVLQWGCDAPATGPTAAQIAYAYTQAWESTYRYATAPSRAWGVDTGTYVALYEWEQDYIDGNDYLFPDTYNYVWMWDFELPASETTTEQWGTGTSRFEVVYTYVRKSGDTVVFESDPSPATEYNRMIGQAITWAIPSDTQITHVRVYRSLADTAGAWYYEGEAAIGSAPTSAPVVTIYYYAYVYAWEDGQGYATDPSIQFGVNTGSYTVLYEWEQSHVGGSVTFPTVYDYVYMWEYEYEIYVDGPPTTTIASYFTLSLRDADLGSAVELTHDRPPVNGTAVIGPSLGGQLFMLVGNLLYYSLPKQPEYWPTAYYLEVSAQHRELMAGTFFGGSLFLAGKDEIFLISGTSSASYFAQPMAAVCGTVARECFKAVKGLGIFHLGNDGIYLYTTSRDENISDPVLKPMFNDETEGGVPPVNKTNIGNCLMEVWQNKLWFGYPTTGETYCKDWIIYDLENKKVTHYQFPTAISAITIDWHNARLIGTDESGYSLVLDDATVTEDNGTAIDYVIESKQFVQYPQYFPRYARWDVELVNGGSATGSVLLAGTVKQTHALPTSRATKKRLVTGCTGTRISVRVSGSGPVKIYGAEVE